MIKRTMLGGSSAALKTLAEELRDIATNFADHQHDKKIAAVVQEAIANARAAAKLGALSCQTYHSALSIADVKTAAIKRLKEEGFGASVSKDQAYSEHANETMMCLTLTW